MLEQSQALQLLVTVTYVCVNSMQLCPMAYESLNHVWPTVASSKVQRGPILHDGHHTLSWLLLLAASWQGCHKVHAVYN